MNDKQFKRIMIDIINAKATGGSKRMNYKPKRRKPMVSVPTPEQLATGANVIHVNFVTKKVIKGGK